MATSSWRDGTREMTGRSRLFSRKRPAKSGRRMERPPPNTVIFVSRLRTVFAPLFERGSVGRARIEASTLASVRAALIPANFRIAAPHALVRARCKDNGAEPWERAHGLTCCCYRRRLAVALQHLRRSGSTLVRGAGSSGKRRAIPRPRQSTTPTSISVWWPAASIPDETVAPEGHPSSYCATSG
jgi:hypothetical protein